MSVLQTVFPAVRDALVASPSRIFQAYEIRPFALLRLAFLLVAHGTIHVTYSSKSVPVYQNKSALYPHIISGIGDTFRFALIDLFHNPVPDRIDLILCLAFSATSLILVAPLRRGIPSFTRPSYQAASLLRIGATVTAVLTSNTTLHRHSVYIIDSFIFTRIIAWSLQFTPIRYSTAYAMAVSSAAVTSMLVVGYSSGHSSGPMIGIAYYLLVIILYFFDNHNSLNEETVEPNGQLRVPHAWIEQHAWRGKIVMSGKTLDEAKLLEMTPIPPASLHSARSTSPVPVITSPWRLVAANLGFTSLRTYMALLRTFGQQPDMSPDYYVEKGLTDKSSIDEVYDEGIEIPRTVGQRRDMPPDLYVESCQRNG